MLHFEQIIDCPAHCFEAFGASPEQVLFFDIETTGFSPDSSYVYLIGCAFLHNNTPTLRQWFLDDISEEKQLVREFGAFAANFSMLVHYNGTTFDIPYLQKKARRHRLPHETGKAQDSFDIYKKLLPHKKLFGLKDLKQKTVEQFLNIRRDDVFSGGDLIPVYTEFVGRYRYECVTRGNPFQKNDAAPPAADAKLQSAFHEEPAAFPDTVPSFEDTGLTCMPESPAKALLAVLLLHNREDITGLLAITDLLGIAGLLAGEFRITELSETADAAPVRSEAAAAFPPSCRVFRLDTKIPARLLASCFPRETARELPLCIAEPGMINPTAPAATGSTGAANKSDAVFPQTHLCITLSLLPDSSDTAEASEASDAFGSLLLSVPVLSGTLKYFFADYREYYYLPFEDCAIHKSVAQFVDKEYRKRATKDTCYRKKSGAFLPQPEELIVPAFRLHAKDTFTYFENANAALSDADTLKKWVCSLLQWLFDKAC